jgi:hypothetical protein
MHICMTMCAYLVESALREQGVVIDEVCFFSVFNSRL